MFSARELLDAAYIGLGLRDGSLFAAAEKPSDDLSEADWLDKGEWLSLAESVGAEKLFFVRDNPVVVFAAVNESDDRTMRETVNRIWCMARPQQLFFARPGELLVLDMTRPPVAQNETIDAHERLLAKVESIAELQSQLAAFRRERLETGVLPEGQGYFSPGDARADKMLVRDLKTVRKALIDAGLDGDKTKFANALIGRSIFIRYLEDRRILEAADFEAVASRRKRWQEVLASDVGVPVETWMEHVRYTKVLSDKDFTYALFDQLASDFNGDIFPVTKEEREAVDGTHLRLLQQFLTGQVPGNMLFFFAYRFDVIPIELISSIYEELYNAESGIDSNQGTHYTPIELVEYLLSKVLTPDCLKSNPTILDPACGSGVFLVEAFRRIVRFRQRRGGRRLGLPELRKIIRDQLRGMDINGEAIRVAAFSLYLALLHHLDPPDIWRDRRLPNLTYDPAIQTPDANRFDILLATNAFTVEPHVEHDEVMKKFCTESIDVVVGNPPWGYPKRKDSKGIAAAKAALDWCSHHSCDVGDQELCQAFIHRALDLLKQGGRCGLLVSTGVFFKHHAKSQAFRRQWLSQACLGHIVNFAAVRDLYFSSGISPFASVVFTKQPFQDQGHFVEYWSAKHTFQAIQMRAVMLSLADRRLVRQVDALADDRVWKTYWWGGHLDYALLQSLGLHQSLEDVAGTEAFGQGFKKANQALDSDWLLKYDVFPVKWFSRYGPRPVVDFVKPPARVERRGVKRVYEGQRLLVKQGISQVGVNGRIDARFETASFCFTNSIHGVSIDLLEKDNCKILLGIFWSSLARYFMWITSGSWGMWHHQLHLDDVRRMPVAFPHDVNVGRRIVSIVDTLQQSHVIGRDLFSEESQIAPTISESECNDLESELDELIFDCYGLSASERQLIRDMCNVGLDLFYRHCESSAVGRLTVPDSFTFGVVADLEGSEPNDILAYVQVFTKIWNQQLKSAGECIWRVIRQSDDPTMIAVVLETIGPGEIPEPLRTDVYSWNRVLRRLDETSVQHDGSRRVFIDGVVCSVGETEIIMIKRNERRLWTASAAREDAEATIVLAMQMQESREGNMHGPS
ncbi:MAG: N-6 DNA methylase [Planctomycetota bacterium]